MNTYKLPAKARRHRAFTLIEMLVVIVVIAILIGSIVAVGSMVRSNASRRTTLAQLHALQGLMDEYLNAGNTEPTIPTIPPGSTSANNWFYGNASDGTSYRTDDSVVWRTKPRSDPFNWVIALKSVPNLSKNLEKLPQGSDAHFQRMDKDSTGQPIVHPMIIDAYGNHIRYVPSSESASGKGYFVSAGPDGKWATMITTNGFLADGVSGTTDGIDRNGGGSISTRPRLAADDIYSTDPQ